MTRALEVAAVCLVLAGVVALGTYLLTSYGLVGPTAGEELTATAAIETQCVRYTRTGIPKRVRCPRYARGPTTTSAAPCWWQMYPPAMRPAHVDPRTCE